MFGIYEKLLLDFFLPKNAYNQMGAIMDFGIGD